MKVIIILSLIAFASAAREFSLFETDNPNSEFEADAETNDPAPESPFLWDGTFLPENASEGDNTGVDVNRTRPTILEIIIGRPMHNPFLFPWRPMGPVRPLFPQRPLFDFGFDDERDDDNITSDDFFPGDFLPDFFGPAFEDPQLKDLPPNYENSTFEVKDINGTKVHVNRTIEKKSGDGFDSFFHVQVFKVVPENSTLEERPFETIPEETNTPKKETEPEFEIPQNYDDSLNQLDSKKTFADEENIEVRRGGDVRRGERTKRSPQFSPSPNTRSSFPGESSHSRLESYDFLSRPTNVRRHVWGGNQGLRSDPEKYFRKNFVFKNMDGTIYDYNLPNSQGFLENGNHEDDLTPTEEPKFATPFEERNLPIDLVDSLPFRTYSRYAPEFEYRQNFVNRFPYETNYGYGPIFPGMRINPLVYQNFPRELNYHNNSPNDFVIDPTNPSERENEVNPNVVVEPPQPAPQRKKVRLIEAMSIPKPLLRSGSSRDKNGKPLTSKYILVPVSHRESTKSASSYNKQPENKSKGSRYGENDVETILVIRPPDLSRDTRVNSIAAERSDSQQGLVQVDPDVEVFDLSLVLKELESHD